MKRPSDKSSSEDVLYAFSIEPRHDRPTFERYLKNYPEYAEELADLFRELVHEIRENKETFSSGDRALMDAAWLRHVNSAPQLRNPFGPFSGERLKEIAQILDVPRQVLTVFRERKVAAESVPGRFLRRFANLLDTTFDIFVAYLKQTQQPRFAGSYKSDSKPQALRVDSFEKVLIDAGVPEAKRAVLLSDD